MPLSTEVPRGLLLGLVLGWSVLWRAILGTQPKVSLSLSSGGQRGQERREAGALEERALQVSRWPGRGEAWAVSSVPQRCWELGPEPRVRPAEEGAGVRGPPPVPVTRATRGAPIPQAPTAT